MDALSRIKQLGMPRRNDELWTFFPVAKIPAPEFPDACTCDEDFSEETDFAALLPIAQNARTMVRDIPEGANVWEFRRGNLGYGEKRPQFVVLAGHPQLLYAGYGVHHFSSIQS